MKTIQDIEAAYLDLNASPETRCNKDRAAEGALICDFMECLTGVDEAQDQLTDAICQLMHFANLSRFDFERAIEMAKINFEAEVEEENEQRNTQ